MPARGGLQITTRFGLKKTTSRVLGPQHIFGYNCFVKFLSRQQPELDRRLLQSAPILVRSLGDLCCIVISDHRVQSGDQHERLRKQLAHALLVDFEVLDAVLSERVAGICQKAGAVERIGHHHWFKDVELKVTVASADRNCHCVAHDLSADHGHRLALRRIDLPGHDRRPGLVFGQLQLTEPTPRSGAQQPNVVGYFHQRARERVESSANLHQRVMGCQRLELVGCGLKGKICQPL
mmetsp:Transcript_8830/g.26545  ORF Transcript_8830/g.26545 Transcript_8830/m.26545 type:complete len:236 (+) Transcript_8830:325-1032(+)